MSKKSLCMRRVVVGNDTAGQSGVIYDSDARNLKRDQHRPGGGMIEHWCWEMPINISDTADQGEPPFNIHPPQSGGFLRFVQSLKAPPGYKVEADPNAVPLHEPIEDDVLERGDRGGKHMGMSGMHKTRSVDYGFLAKGTRSLVLDDVEISMEPGDICVQLGNYHAWANRTDNSLMGYVMIGADFKY